MRREAKSPFGPLTVETSREGILSVRVASRTNTIASAIARPTDGIRHEDEPGEPEDESAASLAHMSAALRALDDYFGGKRPAFEELALIPRGTPFQQRVWKELRNVTYGATTTYGELAARIARPKAARAVGAANGKNPIWLLLPCHRVVGANGTLTGYAGGLAMKRALLEHEALPHEP